MKDGIEKEKMMGHGFSNSKRHIFEAKKCEFD